MNNFLTQSEVVQLTGYSKPSLQIKWLHSNGYAQAKLNGNNEVVLSTLYFHQQSGADLKATARAKKESVIDLESLSAAMEC